MSSQNPSNPPLYPQLVPQTNPSPFSSPSAASLYPSVNTSDLNNLVQPQPPTAPAAVDEGTGVQPQPPDEGTHVQLQPPTAVDETLLHIPGAMLHLIDKQCSVDLTSGDFSIHHLTHGPELVAVIASVSSSFPAPNSHNVLESVQWPITIQTAAVKLDSSHYFFSLPNPSDDEDNNKGKDELPILNYGLTLASKGQASSLSELDEILGTFCNFSEHKVNEKSGSEVLDMSPVEQITAREVAEASTAAYWTTLAPNVEEYSGAVAKGIAKGSGHVVKGIIWCGDVTVERIRWGNEAMKKRMAPWDKSAEISPETLKKIKR